MLWRKENLVNKISTSVLKQFSEAVV